MPIVSCPNCGTRLQAPSEVLGQEVACGRCKTSFFAHADPAEGQGAPRPAPAAPPQQPPAPAGQPTAPSAPAAPPPVGTPPRMPAPPHAPAAPEAAIRPTSGYAVASLVLGIAAIPTVCCYAIPSLICGILALIFHRTAMNDIRAGRASDSSAGVAKAGRICGLIGIVLSIGLWVVLAVLFIAFTVGPI